MPRLPLRFSAAARTIRFWSHTLPPKPYTQHTPQTHAQVQGAGAAAVGNAAAAAAPDTHPPQVQCSGANAHPLIRTLSLPNLRRYTRPKPTRRRRVLRLLLHPRAMPPLPPPPLTRIPPRCSSAERTSVWFSMNTPGTTHNTTHPRARSGRCCCTAVPCTSNCRGCPPPGSVDRSAQFGYH